MGNSKQTPSNVLGALAMLGLLSSLTENSPESLSQKSESKVLDISEVFDNAIRETMLEASGLDIDPIFERLEKFPETDDAKQHFKLMLDSFTKEEILAILITSTLAEGLQSELL